MQFTRRQWLNLAASLLSWFGGLRRLFSPPPEIVDVQRRVMRGSGGSRGKTLTDGPYHTNDAMERHRLLRGSNREGMTIKHAAEFIEALTKDRTLS